MNDDCQTPLDVARVKGNVNVVKAIEEFYGPRFIEMFVPQLLSRKVWNVKTFKNVKGCDDGKQDLEEVVEYLKNPSKFTSLGGNCQRSLSCIFLKGDPFDWNWKNLASQAIQTRLQMAMEVRDSLEIAHTAEDFSKLYAGIAILWIHLSLNHPSVVYCFFFFSDIFPLINER
ncbi:hypothetical protein PVK06_044786 [Gossypium arboreum]|uniref:Uncharacterized protein n=1 Tax=Gossypium arboreum TaxID=29729 RepID=A0ABR0MS61_GOSAR|nr:hypothetical protein PVK06_044786 [Gossypium arboreum]